MLSAQLASLNTETDEAKRREAEEDRLHAQADQLEALRESRRADSVTSRLATMVGTTEARLELLLDVGRAVVLEGLACIFWCFAGVVPTVVATGAVVASGRKPVLQQDEIVVVDSRESVVLEHTDVDKGRAANDPGCATPVEDATTTTATQAPTADAIADRRSFSAACRRSPTRDHPCGAR